MPTVEKPRDSIVKWEVRKKGKKMLPGNESKSFGEREGEP